MRPRIPRAPKLPAFSLYPIRASSGRPPAPACFASNGPAALSSWSALGRELELAANPEPDGNERSSGRGDERPSRLARARAYLGDPRGAANALGIGAAAGLIVASFMLFACK